MAANGQMNVAANGQLNLNVFYALYLTDDLANGVPPLANGVLTWTVASNRKASTLNLTLFLLEGMNRERPICLTIHLWSQTTSIIPSNGTGGRLFKLCTIKKVL